MCPAKAVEWNEMPFGRDTNVVPNNIVLDRGRGPPREGEIWGVVTPSLQRCRLLPNYFGPCFDIFISSLFYLVTFLLHFTSIGYLTDY